MVWFPESERVAATALAVTSNNFGMTIGFLLGPCLVRAGPDVPKMLLVTAVIGAVPFVCSTVHYPKAPTRPPSAAAEVWAVAANSNAIQPTFADGLRLISGLPNYGLLVLSAGVLAGGNCAWLAVIRDLLRPGIYKDQFVGLLGFINSLGANVGAIFGGAAAGQWRCLRKRFKTVIFIGLVVQLVTLVAWSLATSWDRTAASKTTLLLLMFAMGSGGGMTNPFFFELGAEITYPAPEGTSAGIYVLILNFTSLVFIFFSTSGGPTMNWIYVGLTIFGTFIVLAVREVRRRPADAENRIYHRHALTEDHEDTIPVVRAVSNRRS